MGCKSSDGVRFDLGPLPHGQMRVAKLKSAFNLLIIEKCRWPFLVWIHLASGHRCALGLLFIKLNISN